MLAILICAVAIIGHARTEKTSAPRICAVKASTVLDSDPLGICPRMRDLDPLEGHEPWTYKPKCQYTQPGGGAETEAFCLYTRADKASGGGVSLITTPTIAKNFAANSTFSIYSQPLEQYNSQELDAPYEPRELPGRGIGLFALSVIKAGQVILTDRPSFIIAQESIRGIPRKKIEYLQWQGLMQIPAQSRATTRNLAKSAGGDEIDDLLKTNGIGLTLGERKHLTLMPKAARINHACRPNAFYRFDEKKFTLQVFALRQIEAGEEIHFSYGFSDQPSAQRKELLKQNWGFTCSCDLCRSSEKDLFVSDARVKKLVEGREHLASVFSNPRKVLKTVIGLLQLLDEEKLIKEKAKYCEIAMYAANQLGDEEQAKKYGECAQEEWRVMAGPDSFEVRRVEDLLKDPKKHPSWRLNPDASER